MSVIEEIAAERRRQVEQEGWSEKHDDQHGLGEMAHAAAAYALAGRRLFVSNSTLEGADLFPSGWARKWWKPKTRRKDLIRSAALIVAEIERLDRIDARAEKYLAPAAE